VKPFYCRREGSLKQTAAIKDSDPTTGSDHVEHYPCADLPPFLPEISCWSADAATALGLAGKPKSAARKLCRSPRVFPAWNSPLGLIHYEKDRPKNPGRRCDFIPINFEPGRPLDILPAAFFMAHRIGNHAALVSLGNNVAVGSPLHQTILHPAGCIRLGPVRAWARHSPASSSTTVIAKPAIAARRLPPRPGSIMHKVRETLEHTLAGYRRPF
jgi:hypothetical protein